MFVVVEGPDNSGKSTLCGFLSQTLNVEVVHSGGPPRDDEDFAARIENLLHYPEPVIFDRFPVISDQVYGPVLGRGTPVTVADEFVFKLKNPTIIYCRPPIQEMMKLSNRVQDKAHKSQDHIRSVESKALQLIQRYDEVMLKFSSLVLVQYDWTKADPSYNNLLIKWLRVML